MYNKNLNFRSFIVDFILIWWNDDELKFHLKNLTLLRAIGNFPPIVISKIGENSERDSIFSYLACSKLALDFKNVTLART
jgi:hypothetical protein